MRYLKGKILFQLINLFMDRKYRAVFILLLVAFLTNHCSTQSSTATEALVGAPNSTEVVVNIGSYSILFETYDEYYLEANVTLFFIDGVIY